MSEEREIGFIALGMTIALVGVAIFGMGPMIPATVVMAIFSISARGKK